MTNIHVVDMLCGGGKTSAAITHINNSNPNKRFVFITPYLPECARVLESCKQKKVKQPKDEILGRKTTKLSDMRELLNASENIVSTHALFPKYTEDMLDAIKKYHYTLIMDEAYEVVKQMERSKKKEFEDEVKKGSITIDDHGRARWSADAPSTESSLNDLYVMVSNGAIYCFDKNIVIWYFPPEILEAFEEVYILTYYFESQTIKYYLDTLGLEYDYIGTKLSNNGYQFCTLDESWKMDMPMNSLIHVLDNDKLNLVGRYNSLSKSWFEKEQAKDGQGKIKQLARNIRNVQKNIFKCSLHDFMWTVYKDYFDTVQDKNIKKCFVQCSQRATNEYRHKHYLAYCISLQRSSDIPGYFKRHGIEIDVDKWALSEMIQWIWRSAIRDGEEIWIYIPSERMRTLLENWINEVSGQALPSPAAEQDNTNIDIISKDIKGEVVA